MRKLLLFVGTIVFLVIGLGVFAYWQARRTAAKAEAMLVDLQALHLNASIEDAQRFVDTHSGLKGVKCTDSQCDLVIRIANGWLSRLHLSPLTDLGVAFTSSQGRVVRMEASIGVHRVIPGTVQLMYAAEVTEELSDPQLGHESRASVHKLANTAPGVFVPWFVNQRLDERATPQQRKSAYSSLNLACLYKLGGCKDAESLAPFAWTAADKVGWHDETPAEASY